MPKSKRLDDIKKSLSEAKSKEEQDKIWNSFETPIIEDIQDDLNNNLVTFLYRMEHLDFKTQPNIYLYSAITSSFSEESRLIPIPKTDILYLSLVLPSSLRSAYNFLVLDESINTEIKTLSMPPSIFPAPTGKLQKEQTLLAKLFEHGKVEIDPKNSSKIVYYMDYENPDQFFGMESLFELPMAPKQSYTPSSTDIIKEERDKLKKEKRFIERTIHFSDTSLRNINEYKNETRKYWIYFPPGYDSKQAYPLLIFLDGSDFVNLIPSPSILEKMIEDNTIAPSIAVFFDYSMDRRQQEYYCDREFTQFIADDFMSILRDKDYLSITNDPKLATIIGLSASGLAAFYIALTYPNIFGNVVTFSASFESKKQDELEKIISHNLSKNHDTQFLIEAGKYENIPIELQFQDGSCQGLSIYQANKNVFDYLSKNDIKIKFYEFVGGHNYVCWRNSLPNRLKEVYEKRWKKQIRTK